MLAKTEIARINRIIEKAISQFSEILKLYSTDDIEADDFLYQIEKEVEEQAFTEEESDTTDSEDEFEDFWIEENIANNRPIEEKESSKK